MHHTPGFLKTVDAVRPRIKELTVAEARARISVNPKVVLVDVREDCEWEKGHAIEAVHLGKGVLERDIETLFPDTNTEMILYCGGGFRSALATDAAQRMGYKKVASLMGGCRAMLAANWPMNCK
jgi:rhodanese-related sulfurtransferase